MKFRDGASDVRRPAHASEAFGREQMEQDAASGKLDFLFQEADEERRAGKLRDWPENE